MNHLLHTANPAAAIVHRDLKSQNVLVHKRVDGTHACKVADFGLSKATQGTAGNAYGGVGTLAWCAPETFKGDFNETTDCFSFGVLLYEVACRETPWVNVSRQKIMSCVMSKFDHDPELEKDCGWDTKKQLSRWLQKHPLASRRPDLALVEDGCTPHRLRPLMT